MLNERFAMCRRLLKELPESSLSLEQLHKLHAQMQQTLQEKEFVQCNAKKEEKKEKGTREKGSGKERERKKRGQGRLIEVLI